MVPTKIPVKVRRRPLKADLGYTQLVRDANDAPSHFWIVIHSELSHEACWLVLTHEWAHVMSWVEHDLVCDHDYEPWGRAYAKVYQEFVGI